MIIFSCILSTIIITLAFFNYLIIIAVLSDKLLRKSSNIFQYKINNIKLTIFVVIVYIFTFFILLYVWRIYTIDRILNLKRLFDNYHRLWLINISHIDLIFQYCFLLIIIFILLIFIILILGFHKFFLLNIFKLYLYYYYLTNNGKYWQRLYDLFAYIGSKDIISHILWELACISLKKRNYAVSPKYHYIHIINVIINGNHTKVQLLVTISPIIIVFYDIFFNEYTLINIYPYLLIYVPIITLRRITSTAVTDGGALMRILKTMFYEKENDVLYAISKKNKVLLDSFIMSGLRSNITLIDLEYYLASIITFKLNDIEKNIYINNEGKELKLTIDYKVFEYTEDVVFLFDITTKEGWNAFITSDKKDSGEVIPKLGEEWILLLKK